MITVFRFLVCCGTLSLIMLQAAIPQQRTKLPGELRRHFITPTLTSPLHAPDRARFRIPGKSTSKYTAADWGTFVDSAFGPGQGVAVQEAIFDSVWALLDKYWGAFPNLPLNWDSVRAVYRPLIGSGLSRGRFYALISRMVGLLQEQHTSVFDNVIDTAYGNNAWQYKAGVPLLLIGGGVTDPIGAPVTPMPDSSALVYRVDPANPLGLEPGDIIVGYDGVPWNRLYEHLVAAEVPVSQLWMSGGSTPESRMHDILCGVGRNWGLFDTIDVVKYTTGDTVHLSTAPLATANQKLTLSDQVPLAGIPLPDELSIALSVSSGIVAGTNIGYIYVWDWANIHTEAAFKDAIVDLCQNKKVEGLIIDSRMNWGGDQTFANAGLSHLFSFDPSPNLLQALRTSTTDHMAFTIQQFVPPSERPFIPSAFPYDRPIAFLIGPLCLSTGDDVAFLMRFHPMARSFGKPTNGAFITADFLSGSLPSNFWYGFSMGDEFSAVPGEGHLVHKGVQPDEHVWLTRDGVARGEDDVVKRALSWIATLSYAHDAKLSKSAVNKNGDTVQISATVANPGSHTLTVSAIIRDTNGISTDSVLLLNDGLHGDGAAGDSIWGGKLATPSGEGFFGIAVRTDDRTIGTFRRYPDLRTVTSAGPIVVAGYSPASVDTTAAPGKTLTYKISLQNAGTSVAIPRVTAKVRTLDTTVIVQANTQLSYGDLAAGQASAGTVNQRIRYSSSRPGNYPVQFLVDISSNGAQFWTGSFTDMVTGVSSPDMQFAESFSLEQNYPNPFNPSTSIAYSIPGTRESREGSMETKLVVYDLLGREVAVLVNEKKAPGSYEVRLDASLLSSGVYLYRLSSGNFVQTRKMVVLK